MACSIVCLHRCLRRGSGNNCVLIWGKSYYTADRDSYKLYICSIETSAYKMSSSHLSLPLLFSRYLEDIWHYYHTFAQYGKLHELMKTILLCLKDMEHDPAKYIHIQLRIASVLMLLGDISKKAGCVDEAIEEYTEAIKVVLPEYDLFVAKLMHKRGIAYLHHNHYSEAVVDFQSALEQLGEKMDDREVADIIEYLEIALYRRNVAITTGFV
jgi:tetratricopeptide (TPR) repeat protein